MADVKFTGDASDELETWLGAHFIEWLPGERAVLIRFADGFQAKAYEGDTLRLTPEGLIEIWHGPHER